MSESDRDSRVGLQLHTSTQAKRTTVRRSHKKSRNGCRYCKQRRIKCDEIKPSCGNCARSAVVCDYSPKEDDALPIVARGRGRPRKDWTSVAVVRSGGAAASSSSAGLLVSSLTAPPSEPNQLSVYAPLNLQWGVDDMQLFHHYMTSVAINTGDDQLWQRQLPRLAFQHHTILHLLLAVAALHLARSEPRQSAELISKAEAHMNVGLRRATQDLLTLDEKNCAELYITTILICTYTFAKKPGPRNLLVVAEGHEAAWWELFRGVRVIIERVGLPTILARLAPDTGTPGIAQPPTLPQPQQETTMKVPTPLDWENALEPLVLLMEQAPFDHKDIYQNAFNMLKWCYHGTFGMMTRSHVIATPKFETIMAWLYILDDKYVDMLKDNDPLAMLLLAYYAVLLQTLETVWFLEGWALHILRGVREILIETSREQWIHLLHWPQTQVHELAKITSTMVGV